MLGKSSYWLHSVSVVVTAQFHNPSILNPDFLKSNGIIPNDWEPTQVITTPQFSDLHFANGIAWTVDQSKLTVVEACESAFRDEYQAYDLMVSYLRTLEHVPYRNLGLNCVVAVKVDNPSRWLTERYLRKEVRLSGESEGINLIPKFKFHVGDGLFFLVDLDAGTSNLGGDHPSPSVMVNCNLHHEEFLDARSICQAIKRWPERQEFVISTLNTLLGEI